MTSNSDSVALISGITGQDGSYLAELLLAKGYTVHGIKRRSSSLNSSRVDHIYQDPHSSTGKFQLHYGDVTDTSNIIRLIDQIRPSEIYNLAAQSHVQVSFETPEYTANADALGVTRFLESIRILGLKDTTRFYQASTSEMFGLTDQKILNETSEFHPRSPYGVAKLYGYWLTRNYREAYGLFASNGILFNHESPRRGETFVTQKIVQAAIRIAKGSNEVLFLGNLNSIRDWGHAKDFVDSMWRILQHNEPDDWVIATGEKTSVRDFVGKVFTKLNMQIKWEGEGEREIGVGANNRCLVKVDPKYFRPSEVPHLQGDSTKARSILGWKPNFSLDDLIDDMINEQF